MRKIDASPSPVASPEHDGLEEDGICSIAADAFAFPDDVWQHPCPISAFGLRADQGESLDEKFMSFAMVA
jgi:hypothetical protein